MRAKFRGTAWRRGAALLCLCLTVAAASAQPDGAKLRPSFGNALPVAPPPPVELPPRAEQPFPPANAPRSAQRTDGLLVYALQLTPPERGRLFILESEASLRGRMRAEARDRGVKAELDFPVATSTPSTPTPTPMRETPRTFWNEVTKVVEPSYVVSGRLMWEQTHFERHGVSLGVLQPPVSTGVFVCDTLLWPLRTMRHPFRWNQVNTDSFTPYFMRIGAVEHGQRP